MLRQLTRNDFLNILKQYPVFKTITYNQQDIIVNALEEGCYNYNERDNEHDNEHDYISSGDLVWSILNPNDKNHLYNYQPFEVVDSLVKYVKKEHGSINPFRFSTILKYFNKYNWSHIRHKYFDAYYEILNDYTLVSKIEKSCFNASIQQAQGEYVHCKWTNESFTNIYILISARVLENMDCNSTIHSSTFVKKLKNKEIDPDTVGFMTSHELCPEKSQSIVNEIIERSNQKLTAKTSKIYKCSKCKKMETTAVSVQLRALDEGESFHITCNFCGHDWIHW